LICSSFSSQFLGTIKIASGEFIPVVFSSFLDAEHVSKLKFKNRKINYVD